jgi:hypothetical protein
MGDEASKPRRRFDWDEAAKLRSEGWSYERIAKQLGVSASGVQRVLVPGLAEKMLAHCAAWQSANKPWRGVCPGCGGPASNARGDRARCCLACASKRRATSVRADTLRCSTCRRWLSDDHFPRQAACIRRRGRHRQCRSCGAIVKRDYRATPQGKASDQRANQRKRANRQGRHD